MLLECPWKVILPQVLDVPLAADLATKGSWPVGGGWLDQTSSTLCAVRTWWSIESAARTEAGLD